MFPESFILGGKSQHLFLQLYLAQANNLDFFVEGLYLHLNFILWKAGKFPVSLILSCHILNRVQIVSLQELQARRTLILPYHHPFLRTWEEKWSVNFYFFFSHVEVYKDEKLRVEQKIAKHIIYI